MNVAAQDRSIEDIFIFDERKFRLVGAASNFLHQLRIVAAAGLFVSSVQPRLSRDIAGSEDTLHLISRIEIDRSLIGLQRSRIAIERG